MKTELAEATETRSPRYQRRLEEILDRAAKVFNTQGVRGATLNDVADEVGVNLTSLRNYFPRREDLVAALVERSITRSLGRLKEASSEATVEARMKKLVHLHFRMRRQIREGVVSEVIQFADLRNMKSPYSDKIWPMYSEMFRGYRALLTTPEFRKDNRPAANARAQTLMAQLLRSLTWLPDYELMDFERVEERFLDILFNGIAAPGEPWAPQAIELPALKQQDKRSLESFLHAATQMINQQGYRGTSIKRVAEQLNVTKGSFYHHAEDKDELLAACCDRTVRILSEAQELAMSRTSRGLDQALTAAASLTRLQLTPDGSLLRNSALTSVKPETRQSMSRRMAIISQRFSDMIADGIKDGSCRPCNPHVAGHMIMALINSSEEIGPWVPGVNQENSADLYVRPIFRGLFA